MNIQDNLLGVNVHELLWNLYFSELGQTLNYVISKQINRDVVHNKLWNSLSLWSDPLNDLGHCIIDSLEREFV